MATVKRSVLAYDSTIWANWFGSLDCSLVSIDGTNIIIDDIFMIKLERINYWPAVALYKDGTMVISSTVAGLSTVTVGYSDTLFYVYTRDQNGSSGIGIFLVYEKTPEFRVYTYANSTGHPNIQTATFTDMVTGATYNHSGVLKYNTQPGYINYTSDVLLIGSTRSYIDPNFISCSNVNADSVITFGGKNYYSAGPNTLIRMN